MSDIFQTIVKKVFFRIFIKFLVFVEIWMIGN